MAVFLFVVYLISAASLESVEIDKSKGGDGDIVYSHILPPPGVDTEARNFKEEATGRPAAKESLPQPIKSLTP